MSTLDDFQPPSLSLPGDSASRTSSIDVSVGHGATLSPDAGVSVGPRSASRSSQAAAEKGKEKEKEKEKEKQKEREEKPLAWLASMLAQTFQESPLYAGNKPAASTQNAQPHQPQSAAAREHEPLPPLPATASGLHHHSSVTAAPAPTQPQLQQLELIETQHQNPQAGTSFLFISDGDTADADKITLELMHRLQSLEFVKDFHSLKLLHTSWKSEEDFNDPLLETADRVIYVAKKVLRLKETLIGHVSAQYKKICGDKLMLVFYDCISSRDTDPASFFEDGVVVRATYQSTLVNPSPFNDSQISEIGARLLLMKQQ